MQFVGNADVILADGAVFPLVVSTNNVGASAEDSVVLDVLSVVVFTSLISVKVMMPLLFVLL